MNADLNRQKSSSNDSNNDGAKNPIVKRGADRRALLCSSHEAHFPQPFFSCDQSGCVVSYNEAAAALWGRRPDSSLPAQWDGAFELLGADDAPLPRWKAPAARAFHAGANIVGAPITLRRPDGSLWSGLAYAKPTLNSDGIASGALCALIERSELDEITSAAAKAEDDRSAFLTMLSHELRNPLSPILNSAVLLKRMSSDAQVYKIADVVERQAKRLSRFVHDLLEAANLAQGGVVLKLAQSTLADVMEAAVDSLAPMAASRGQIVSVEPAPRACLLCDAERVSQALANIMANPSEFTGDGGTITARASVDGVWARVEVEDNGIGIAPSDIDNIFKPYTHFATHAERARAGAGLGLALAKDICEKHGGKISASSPGIGKGSVFTISLPVVSPESAEAGLD